MFLRDLLEEPLQEVTLVYGPAASGKTTLCLEALGGKVAYISSGRNFSPERLTAMRADSDAVLERTMLFEASDLPAFERAVEQAVALSPVLSLIIIDSVATLVRAAPKKIGNLALHRALATIARSRCPVLLTSEVYDRAEGMYDVQFVGGDMLRLPARTIVELKDGVATVKKHPLHIGREWNYKLVAAGLERVTS